MAFSYTTDGYDKVGKRNVVWGTWNAASVTTGTISFGPINGLSINALVDARVVNSVSVVTETAKKLVVGTATTQPTIVLTCVSSDKGYWSAEWI
jgi:hypothetical protein